LRERLGFGGVAVTDCLEMDAVSAGIGVARGAVLALRAGNDLVMVSHRIDRQTAALDALLAAARSGEIPAGRIREAAGRVLQLKRRLAWDHLPDARGLDIVGSAEHRRLAVEAYAASATLVRDRDALLPLRLDSAARLLVVRVPACAIMQAADDPFTGDTLLDAVRQHHPRAEAALLSPSASPTECEDAVRRAGAADAVLLVTVDVSRDPERRALAQRIAAAAPRVVGIAAGVPHDAAAVPAAGAYLAAYEYTAPALGAALAVVFGRAPAPGRLPVTAA
jgi:beta-N-acetylhexosaminidase